MARFIHKGSKKAGQVPGTATYIGEERAAKVIISRFEYDEADVAQTSPDSVEKYFSSLESQKISWLNVDGVHDVEKIQRIGAGFNTNLFLHLFGGLNKGRPNADDLDQARSFALTLKQKAFGS